MIWSTIYEHLGGVDTSTDDIIVWGRLNGMINNMGKFIPNLSEKVAPLRQLRQMKRKLDGSGIMNMRNCDAT